MPSVQNKGVRIAYHTRGEGTPIVLLMGLGLPGVIWGELVDALAERNFFVVIPDNRGTGDSDAPMPPYSMKTMAADVVSVMEDAGVDSAQLVGVSFGGMLAQHVALDYPDRIEGLMLASTTCGLPHGKLPHPRAVWLLLKMAFFPDRMTFEEARQLFCHPDSADTLRAFLERVERQMQEAPTPMRASVGQLGAVIGHSTGARLSELKAPTRICTGDSDILIPPENAEILAELIPGATLTTIPRAGHIALHEYPNVALEQILALRQQVEGARAAQ